MTFLEWLFVTISQRTFLYSYHERTIRQFPFIGCYFQIVVFLEASSKVLVSRVIVVALSMTL
jgi:hypothetical protein